MLLRQTRILEQIALIAFAAIVVAIIAAIRIIDNTRSTCKNIDNKHKHDSYVPFNQKNISDNSSGKSDSYPLDVSSSQTFKKKDKNDIGQCTNCTNSKNQKRSKKIEIKLHGSSIPFTSTSFKKGSSEMKKRGKDMKEQNVSESKRFVVRNIKEK